MNKYFIPFLILAILNFSCNEKPNLELTNSKNIPEDIEGCACYFSNNSKLFKDSKYCFVNNFENVAYISLNNRLIKLKLKSSGRKPHTFGEYDYKEIYENDTLKVYLNLKFTGEAVDEVWKETGTIKIENVSGKSIVEKIEGECGC